MAIKSQPHRLGWSGTAKDVPEVSQKLTDQLYKADQMFEILFKASGSSGASLNLVSMATQTCAHDTFVPVQYAVAFQDTSFEVAADRVIFKQPGIYFFTAETHWSVNGTAQRRIVLARQNGATFPAADRQVGHATIATTNTVSGLIQAAESDSLEILAYQDTGSSLTCGTPSPNRLSIFRIS